MYGVLVTLLGGAPPVAIPCANQAHIPPMMAHLRSALSLPPERRLDVMTLGTLPALEAGGVSEVPLNLIPLGLVASAQIVDFRVTDEGGMYWLPVDLARAMGGKL